MTILLEFVFENSFYSFAERSRAERTWQSGRKCRVSYRGRTGSTVDFLGTFDLHFVAEDAVNGHGCRAIRTLERYPSSAFACFHTGRSSKRINSSAGQSVKSPIYAAYQKIELGARRDRRSFLGGSFLGNVSVALQPGVQFLQFLRRKFVQTGRFEFAGRHHFLNAARHFLRRRKSGCDASEHHAKAKNRD